MVDAVEVFGVVVLGPCTPDELSDWPPGRWPLLDSSDEERGKRLMGRQTFHDPADALEDARSHRSLGLPSLDTTGQSPTITAGSLTELIRGLHR